MPPTAPRSPARVDAILEALERGRAPTRRGDGRTPTTRCSPCTTPTCSTFLRTGRRALAAGPVRRAGRPGPRGALPLPDAGDDRRPARPPGRRRARRGRPFAYDTMTLVGAGHLGGRPGGRRLRPHRGRPRRWRASALAYALCRPPGHHATPAGFGGSCYLNNAAVAAQALRDGGHERVGGRRHRRAPRQRHRGDLLRPRGRALRVGARRPGRRAGSRTSSGYADETGAGAGAGATLNLPLPAGTGDGRWLEAVARLADWVGAAGLHGAGGLARRRRRGRRPGEPAAGHRRRLPRGRPACSARPGLPAVVVQEGGYHLPTLGGLVAAYLDGHVSR